MLTSLQQRLVKHARYWLLLAEGHLNRWRFGAMLGRIALIAPYGRDSELVAESARALSIAGSTKERYCEKWGRDFRQ